MTDTVPPWLATMRQITGTHALNDNPVILGWAKKIGELYPDLASYCAGYTNDTIAWCGLTVGYCMAVNGIKPVFGATDTDRFLYALAWKQFGTAGDTPQAGDVLVFDFGGGDHHVTLFEQAQNDFYICRGGNQSHQVKVSTYPKSQCIAIRRPPAAAANVQPVAQAPAVQLFSGITATMFGGAADPNTSAYDGHMIDDTELGVALPARFSSPRPQVRVWNGGKSAICNIVDIGPWNTNDPYWQTGARPEAESGVDSRGRTTNRAGIDLTPAAARAIGIDGKGTVDWEFADAALPAPPPQSPPLIPGDPMLGLLQQLIAQVEAKMTAAPTTPAVSPPASGAPPAQPDLAALMQQIIGLAQTINAQPAQPAAATTAQLPDQIKQIANLLTMLTGVASGPAAGTPPALGPVNGALGQTIGNLLNGNKSAIGIIGALLTSVLQVAGPSAPLSAITPLLGAGSLGGVAMPIFLAMAAWGVLGKLEKWAQASAPPSPPPAGK